MIMVSFDTPLDWFEECCDKTIYESFSTSKSSCAGPVVFTLYIAALNKVAEYLPEVFGYADSHKLAMTLLLAAVTLRLQFNLQVVIGWLTDYKLVKRSFAIA